MDQDIVEMIKNYRSVLSCIAKKKVIYNMQCLRQIHISKCLKVIKLSNYMEKIKNFSLILRIVCQFFKASYEIQTML